MARNRKSGAEQPSPAERLAKKAEELRRIRRYVDQTTFAGDQRESVDELSVMDQHPADVADQTLQRELDMTVKRILDIEEQQIREALARQREGKYGICEECGRDIDPERLQARPEATLCIDCQRERERNFGRHTGPL